MTIDQEPPPKNQEPRTKNQEQTLSHPAMATEFRLTLVHPDARYARQAAQAAFQELEGIESRLSRYQAGSDISRINRLEAGQSVVVHPDTHDCLEIAEQMRRGTGGAFDIAYATPNAAASPRWELGGRLVVRSLTAGLRLDLGGIGKGFALDRLAAVLSDWDIASALLAASTSTLLARGMPPGAAGWTVQIGFGAQPQALALTDRAISASGTGVRGDHVVDSRRGRPSTNRRRVWAAVPTAARADALSTALMLMDDEAIRTYCGRHPGVAVWRLEGGALVSTRGAETGAAE